jgi:hypothetical protein
MSQTLAQPIASTMNCCFAIVPDGAGEPAAVFEELEDAMDWGVKRYGNDAFQIRFLEVATVEQGGHRAAAS